MVLVRYVLNSFNYISIRPYLEEMGLDTPCRLTVRLNIIKSRFLFNFQFDLHIPGEILFTFNVFMSRQWFEMWCRVLLLYSKWEPNRPLHTGYDVTEIAWRWQPNNLVRSAAFSSITGCMIKCTSFKEWAYLQDDEIKLQPSLWWQKWLWRLNWVAGLQKTYKREM